MKIIAKMVCESVGTANGAEQIVLRAVYGDSEENKSFSEATPSASVSMSISNKAAHGAFVQGEEYYVEFKPVKDTVKSTNPTPVISNPTK